MQKFLFTISSILIFLTTFSGAPQQRKRFPIKFSHPDIISYNHDGFIIHGKPVFIYSGSFHYFRCDSSDWMDRLEKIKAAGFNTIETYVPWNWHEREQGHPNFEPLDRFLDDCQKAGLYVIVRPGPYICAEWNVGGFPLWLEGKDVGYRTASAADISWSKYWYDEVLPVIRKHLITNGGNIILMQIENEYDYYPLPDSQKIIYLKSLYETAIQNGINIPIITCWTKQVRDKYDSVFSQIMDACNFYPGWNIESTRHSIDLMKSEEPSSPPMITELQGGWFSEEGDKSVRRVEDFGPNQIADLTDYVIAHGIKALSYYMLYGGTNFGYWGSFDKTTSYDYTAPISEPGGLWEKYRRVKLIGDFIRLEGDHLINSHEVKGGATCDNKDVEAILRTDGKSGFIFVWNKKDQPVNARVSFKTPLGSEANIDVHLEARGSYLLPVELPFPNGEVLHYSNVPISAIATVGDKPLIVAYGTPGQEASIYAGTSYCTGDVKQGDELLKCNNLYVLLTTEERAARSRVFETKSGPVTIVSDSYLMEKGGHNGSDLGLRLQTRPGDNTFAVLAAGKVSSVTMDGKPVRSVISPRTGMVNFSFTTPDFTLRPIPIRDLKVRSDAQAQTEVAWKEAPVSGDSILPLDIDGDTRGGYTVYSGEFTFLKNGLLKCDYYYDDWHSVLVDGKVVPGLTGSDEESLSATELSAGKHQIDIYYENEGWPNGGFMEQHKGLKSISYSADGQITALDDWKHSPKPEPLPKNSPQQASPDFNDASWHEVKVGNGSQSFIRPNKGWWFRKSVMLTEEALRSNTSITFKGVDDNAFVFVNGHFAADNYGYDIPFTVSLAKLGKPGENVIALYVQNTQGGGGIWRPVVLKWGTPEPLDVSLKYHYELAGEIAGWEKTSFDNLNWKPFTRFSQAAQTDGITWYRGDFTLPAKPGWIIPWRLHMESTGSAQIWINGRLFGRYSSRGPQKDFYLPDGWLNMKGTNSIVLVLRQGSDDNLAPTIKNVYIAPYSEYVVQRHEMEIGIRP